MRDAYRFFDACKSNTSYKLIKFIATNGYMFVHKKINSISSFERSRIGAKHRLRP